MSDYNFFIVDNPLNVVSQDTLFKENIQNTNMQLQFPRYLQKQLLGILLRFNKYFLGCHSTNIKLLLQLFRLFTFTWPFGEVICKLTAYIQDVSVVCSVLNLTAMSMERFYAIVYPLRSRRVCTVSQARSVVALTWFLALILALPRCWIQVRIGYQGFII